MLKPFSTSDSLWLEQARRGTPLTPAAGGFAIGVVLAIAAYNVISNFVRPATVQEPAAQRVLGLVPVLAPVLTPTVTPAPAQHFISAPRLPQVMASQS